MIHAIPYMGSKRKIARVILNFLRNIHPEAENLYDLFGGGGAISFNALGLFKEVHAISHRSILSATNKSKKTIEKIFWNGKGKYFKTTLF